MKTLLIAGLCACSTTLNASSYSRDCDADDQCKRIVVGDVCSCTCALSAINARDYDRYLNDLENIGTCRTTCTGDSADAGYQCGLGIGAGCSAGTCVNVVIDASSE